MSTIDLFLINKPNFFFETYTTVATITINVFQLSLHLEHQEWNQNISYGNYAKFDEALFR